MTPEQINVAIAEKCGWSRCKSCAENDYESWRRPSNDGCEPELPDYLNDLNAMHDAEAFLVGDEVDSYVGFLLEELEFQWRLVRATATQKSKAFLRAIGKWNEKAIEREEQPKRDYRRPYTD